MKNLRLCALLYAAVFLTAARCGCDSDANELYPLLLTTNTNVFSFALDEETGNMLIGGRSSYYVVENNENFLHMRDSLGKILWGKQMKYTNSIKSYVTDILILYSNPKKIIVSSNTWGEPAPIYLVSFDIDGFNLKFQIVSTRRQTET